MILIGWGESSRGRLEPAVSSLYEKGAPYERMDRARTESVSLLASVVKTVPSQCAFVKQTAISTG